MQVGEPFSPYRVFTGVFIPDALIAYRGISASEKICLARLYRYCGKSKHCWPSQDELADELGVEVRSVHGYLTRLHEQGFIRIEQRGLHMTNMYVMLRHPVLFEDPDDDLLTGNNLPVKTGKDTAVLDRQESSGPLHLLTEESQLEESQYMDLSSVVSKFKRHRGFRKPTKRDVEYVGLDWKEQVTHPELDAALDRYFDCEEMKKQGYPFVPFAKTIRKWIPMGFVADLDAPEDIPVRIPPADAPQPVSAAPVVDVVEAWNREVPAGPPVEIWKPDPKLRTAYLEAVNDPQFVANLPKILARCQEAHRSENEKRSFLTFRWMLSNWHKILNGEIGWLSADARSAKSKSGQGEGLQERMRKRMEAQKKA